MFDTAFRLPKNKTPINGIKKLYESIYLERDRKEGVDETEGIGLCREGSFILLHRRPILEAGEK